MLKIRKTFKYRLFPNRKQREALLATLEVCRHLYNDALQERREAWKLCHQSVTFAMQSAQLPACKEADVAMQGVYSQKCSKTFSIAWTKRTRRSFDGATVSRASKAKAGLIPSPTHSLVSV